MPDTEDIVINITVLIMDFKLFLCSFCMNLFSVSKNTTLKPEWGEKEEKFLNTHF